MTQQKKEVYLGEPLDLPFEQLNNNVEFYIVEGGKEKENLKKFFTS